MRWSGRTSPRPAWEGRAPRTGSSRSTSSPLPAWSTPSTPCSGTRSPAPQARAHPGRCTAGSSWPLNIPPSGKQTQYKLNVPYRFFGLSEALSWLAQFEGQGFEDISALANLVLLQEMMMGEEYQLLAGTSQNLQVPAAPSVTTRTAGSNDTALSGVTANISVKVTALTYFGETPASPSSGNIPWSAGQVADVTITPVPGAQQYNIYVATNSGDGHEIGRAHV